MSGEGAKIAAANRCDAAAMAIRMNRLCVAGRVRVAESFVTRFAGLLGRRELRCDEGLLINPGGSVHTLGMRFAIDVLFLDRRMCILKIVPTLRPGRIALAPPGTCKVLEIMAGRAALLGLHIGMQLAQQGACLRVLEPAVRARD